MVRQQYSSTAARWQHLNGYGTKHEQPQQVIILRVTMLVFAGQAIPALTLAAVKEKDRADVSMPHASCASLLQLMRYCWLLKVLLTYLTHHLVTHD